jgi:uncharacterized FlaG/YvyC family protein
MAAVEGTGGLHTIRPVARSHDERPQDERPSRRREEGQRHPSLEEVVSELNEAVRALNARLSFSLNTDGPAPVVRVVDTLTGRIVRQYPAEEALRLASHVRDLPGLLVDGAA